MNEQHELYEQTANTKTDLSLVILKPRKTLFNRAKAVANQVKEISSGKPEQYPDLIIIPHYTNSTDELLEAYYAARTVREDVALFSKTIFVQRIDAYAPHNKNPLRNLKYGVEEYSSPVIEGLNLDFLVIFGGEEIKADAPLFKSIRPGGYLVWVDDKGAHEVFHKHTLHAFGSQLEEVIEDINYRVFNNKNKSLANCVWYDLKF